MNLEGFLESLEWRYATKSFDKNKKVSEQDLTNLIKSLTLSPSSYGLQPWKFFVVENLAIREQLQPFSWNQPQITECSHLIVLATRESMDAKYIESYVERIAKERTLPVSALDGYKGMMLDFLPMIQGPNGHNWMTKQVYIALGVLLSACAIARIDSCPMEGFNASKYDEILGLPQKGYNARVLCPIGYRSESDKLADMKKVRFDTNELVERIK